MFSLLRAKGFSRCKYLPMLLIPVLLVTVFICLGFYFAAFEKKVKTALVLDESVLSDFREYFENYVVVTLNKGEAELLTLNITKELYNTSFYAPIIVLLGDSDYIEGVIVGYPSRLFLEEMKSCADSFNCTPFIAYAAHLPQCKLCPKSNLGEKIEILARLPEEKIAKLIAIIKPSLRKSVNP
ncbi:MAG: hypothetical protein QXY49_05635 [Thermofilaceae archaeon]